MAHRHTLGVEMTGPDRELKDGTHDHRTPDNGFTSRAEDGPNHRHTYKGKRTGLPMPMDDDMMDDAPDMEDMMTGKKKKKRKKSKKKPTWSY